MAKREPMPAITQLAGSHPVIRDDRVLLETRILAVVVVPVLLWASAVLLVFPSETEEHFAWPIKAHMSSFALAVPYLAGAYYFSRLLLDGRWHRFAAGLLPVGAFVTAEAIATVLHWDRFTHDIPAFWLWASLYLTTPLIIPLVWWRNQQTDPGTPEVHDVNLPTAARVSLLVTGVCQLSIASFLLIFPGSAIDIWPWPLTPLTARSTAGWFAFGLVGVMLARQTRWSAARVIVEAMLLGFGLAVVCVIRAWDEFDQELVTTWIFLATLAVVLVLMSVLYVAMEARRRRVVRGQAAIADEGLDLYAR